MECGVNESYSPRRHLRAKYEAIFGKTTSLSAWYTAGTQKYSSEWGKQWREILEAQDYVGPMSWRRGGVQVGRRGRWGAQVRGERQQPEARMNEV